MKVTFPHMGHLKITAKALFKGLGLDVVVPPPCTRKTLSIGTKHSPEFACLPLKINLGNYLEARELGADTVIMGGGVGPCRFGYYAQIQQEILKDLGIKMDMVVLEPPDVHFSEVIDKLRYITKGSTAKVIQGIYMAWAKTSAVDELEKIVHGIRPRQKRWGEADRVFTAAIKAIDAAENKKEVKRAMEYGKKKLNEIALDEKRDVIKIVIAGEIYTVLEPFVNFEIEKKLGKMGVEVIRSISLSNWIKENLLGGLLPFSATRKKHEEAAKPYLNSFVGGHGRETISNAVENAKAADGLIQLAPLTCMPEIVAHSVVHRVSNDYNLPVMTLYIDEQTGEAGLLTRLEAFVDMLKRKRISNEKVVK